MPSTPHTTLQKLLLGFAALVIFAPVTWMVRAFFSAEFWTSFARGPEVLSSLGLLLLLALWVVLSVQVFRGRWLPGVVALFAAFWMWTLFHSYLLWFYADLEERQRFLTGMGLLLVLRLMAILAIGFVLWRSRGVQHSRP